MRFASDCATKRMLWSIGRGTKSGRRWATQAFTHLEWGMALRQEGNVYSWANAEPRQGFNDYSWANAEPRQGFNVYSHAGAAVLTPSVVKCAGMLRWTWNSWRSSRRHIRLL